MDELLTVRDVADRIQKSEETVKRWLRSGKFPNAYKVNDKKGWKIPHQDLQTFQTSIKQPVFKENKKIDDHSSLHPPQDENSKELVSLAYQLATKTLPTEIIIERLIPLGIKRVIEILLIMRQSPKIVRNPEGFIRKAIDNNWSLTTSPVGKTIKRKPLSREEWQKQQEQEQQQYDESVERSEYHRKQSEPIPFYNWLEQD